MTSSAQDARNLATLTTERVDEQYRDLDRRSTLSVLTALNEAEAQVPQAVRAVLPVMAPLVEAAAERLSTGGRLVYVGAGTSGRLGVLDAAECPPTFHVSAETVTGLIAGGPRAIFATAEAAEDSAEAGAADVQAIAVGPGDTVVGIAASGRTPYVLGAVRTARAAGALTAGITCNTGSPLAAAVHHPLEVEVGPEVIAGSTRLKAGSATKQLLNMLSTAVMVRNGKTYQNLMVDLTISNDKLRDRGERLLARITGCTRAEAATALRAAGDRIPVAAVMLVRAVGPGRAGELLDAADGHLAQVIDPA